MILKIEHTHDACRRSTDCILLLQFEFRSMVYPKIQLNYNFVIEAYTKDTRLRLSSSDQKFSQQMTNITGADLATEIRETQRPTL